MNEQLAREMLSLIRDQRLFFEKQMKFYEAIIRTFIQKSPGDTVEPSKNFACSNISQEYDEYYDEDFEWSRPQSRNEMTCEYDGEDMEEYYDDRV